MISFDQLVSGLAKKKTNKLVSACEVWNIWWYIYYGVYYFWKVEQNFNDLWNKVGMICGYSIIYTGLGYVSYLVILWFDLNFRHLGPNTWSYIFVLFCFNIASVPRHKSTRFDLVKHGRFCVSLRALRTNFYSLFTHLITRGGELALRSVDKESNPKP